MTSTFTRCVYSALVLTPTIPTSETTGPDMRAMGYRARCAFRDTYVMEEA